MAHPSRPAPKSIAELIGGAIDPLVRKRGLARAELIAWWPDIVGAAYAGRTAPERIRWPRDGSAATLVVRCDPSLSLQFAHEIDRIRERLNGYFGYAAVGAVKIVQKRVGGEPKARPKPSEGRVIPPAMEAKIERLDAPLRESMSALARNILAGS